ncbi:MAG: phosphoadenosine phosphosulfate reductase family protein [Deltaproteobacteria bacterium]|nr:phosphoadenosine phosphosulfate reductase family protein [Deltaproteobacteria bacterium]
MASIIPSFSGGKDSTYMVLRLHELGIKMADIVYFDTGWEFPEMEPHIAQVEDFIKQKVTVLKPREPFDFMFSKKIRTRGEFKGLAGYGWAKMRSRWCTAEKRSAMAAHTNALTWRGLVFPIVQAIGYAADEQGRAQEHSKKKIPNFQGYDYPMVTWGTTETQALSYCKERGFYWSGLYDIFDRVSCTVCPLGGIERARKIYNHFPAIWHRMLEMDSWLPKDHKGKKYTGEYTVDDLGMRFANEATLLQQGTLPGIG